MTQIIDLDTLFAKDPTTLTDSELIQIISELRRQRSQFILEEKKGKKANPAAANLSLADLQLKLG